MRICVNTTILIDILKNEFRSYQENLHEALEREKTWSPPSDDSRNRRDGAGHSKEWAVSGKHHHRPLDKGGGLGFVTAAQPRLLAAQEKVRRHDLQGLPGSNVRQVTGTRTSCLRDHRWFATVLPVRF